MLSKEGEESHRKEKDMIKFGTGGWRAVIGDGFTKQNIQVLATALCRKMQKEGVADKGVVIGYDRRFLSKEAMRWAGEVFAANGIVTRLINYSVPTPLVMYYVMYHDLPYGMMVTASHNPAIYNGIKVFTRGGRDADEVQTRQLEQLADAVQPEEVRELAYEDALAAGIIEEIYPLNEYLDNILDTIDIDRIRAARLRIALDPLYGVSEASIKTILMTARCQVESIHENHDTLFGGHLPAPNEQTLRTLQAYVLERRCDLGLALDGDGDRLGVIDDEGTFLHPNKILCLLYYYLVRYKGWKGPAVRNIATTHMLDRIAQDFGEQCYEVPVGFKYVSAKMAETDAVIGGESSGGLTVRGHVRGKDGVYAASLLVEMAAVIGKPLSQIVRDLDEKYGSFYMEERDYKLHVPKKEEIRRMLFEEHRLPELPRAVERVSYVDGCKIYLQGGGWVVIRFSGTEPLLRMFCEWDSEAQAKAVLDSVEIFLGIGEGSV